MIEDRVLERLRSQVGDAFRLIDGALALSAVKDRPNATPALFVVPLEEVSDGIRAHVVRQWKRDSIKRHTSGFDQVERERV